MSLCKGLLIRTFTEGRERSESEPHDLGGAEKETPLLRMM